MFTTSNELENNTGENYQCAENIIEYYGGGMLFRRWLATLIDFILLGSLIFFLVGISNLLGDRIFAKTVFIWVILLVCIFVCYHFIQEAITGYTIGKFIMRIKVVDSKCDAPGLKKAIIRTLFRIIEINPLIFGGIPAGIAVLTSKKKQRIGDAVANTYVVRCCDINRKNDSNIKKRISLFIALFTILAIIIGGIGFYNTIGKSIIDNMNFRTFIGSDNKTQITCPSNWEKMKVEKLFSRNSEVKLYAVRADMKT